MSIKLNVSGLEDLADQIENMADTLEESSEEYLSQFYLGETVNIDCPICGKQTDAEIIAGGNVKCLICNTNISLNIELE
ncbi:hypothetical protein [Metaclostridioides mangenotii]|uniref:hypothetical protein n=1 Tax=Metaclostridioides mangenotii TaxID=1540 RepID=UPI0026EAA912|nr:hypothetical protein [Clostridioides mangenotii]